MVYERYLYVKKMMEHVDLFIAPSQFLRNEYIKFGIHAEKILHSDYGFDTSYYPDTSKHEHNSDKIQFSFVGTPITHKGLHILIQAFNKLSAEKAKLCIYGDTSLFPRYTSYLRILSDKNANITFKGPFENSQISTVLSETDALIVPSLWYENSPLVIHEAFLSGVFVIASHLGGIPELVQNGVNGFLFKPGDINDLRGKMLQFIRDYNAIRDRRLNADWIKTIEKDAEDLEKRYTSFMKSISDPPKPATEQIQSSRKSSERILRTKSNNLYLSKASSAVGESLVQHKPLEAYLEAASVCNLHCKMCARTFDPRFHPGTDRLGMMSLDTIRLLDGIMPTLLKCYVMGNGEPLINPRFVDIVSFLKTHFVETSFTTNATLMTPEMSEIFVRLGVDSITFSIDGATSQTYERIRRGANFEEVVAYISKLQEIKQRHGNVKPNMILACVIMTDNIHEITELIKLAKLLGMTHVHFEDLLWQNDPDYIDFYHKHSISMLKRDEISGYFHEAIQAGHELGIKLTSQWFDRLGMHASRMREPSNTHMRNKMTGELVCAEPWTTIYVTWNGDVLTCCASEKIFGNLNTQNIYEIWHGNTFEEYRNQMAGYNIPKECDNCLKNGRPKNVIPEMEQILKGCG
jgi:MoaA/NifB/PqqE/SkfB family radical SAM enzyme